MKISSITFIQAINQQNKVELTYTPDIYLQSKTKTASEPAQTKIVLSPVHIRADIRFGRYFIFGVNESGAAQSFKISNIDDIKILEKEHFNLPEAQAAVQNTFANSIISPRILPEAPYDVILKFYQSRSQITQPTVSSTNAALASLLMTIPTKSPSTIL